MAEPRTSVRTRSALVLVAFRAGLLVVALVLASGSSPTAAQEPEPPSHTSAYVFLGAGVGLTLGSFLIADNADHAYDRYLDEVTGTVARPGNHVTLLDDGPGAFKEIYAAIDSAKSSINVSSYQFTDDETGREYAKKLIAAAKRGVAVNVITDAQANIMVGGGAMVKLLRENGVNVVENEGEPLMTSMDHRKFAIVDGKVRYNGP